MHPSIRMGAPAPAPTAERRKPQRYARSSRDAVVVVIVALLAASLFNAAPLLVTAQTQDFGWKRSIAVGVMTPVAAVARFTHLTSVRSGLDDALSGPSEEPALMPRNPLGRYLPDDGSAPAPPPVPMWWVGGDSLAYDVAIGLQRLGAEAGAPGVHYLTRRSTGLARPDVLNWPKEFALSMAEQNPSVAVVMVGGNDDQDMTVDGHRVVVGTDAWVAEYSRRVRTALDALSADGRHVVWVGLPIMRDARLTEVARVMNAVYATETAARGATFVDTFALFADEKGAYADYLPDGSGKLERMRVGDGVHLTPAGSDRVARAVAEAIKTAR